jgi:uncharacterized protein (DUF362 family)
MLLSMDDRRYPDSATGDSGDAGHTVPREAGSMDRRRFLRLVGAGALAAGVAPWATGCGRLLDWSAGRQTASRRQMAGSPPTTGMSSTVSGAGGTTSTSTTGSTTGGTGAPGPDLVVVQGSDPGENVRRAVEALDGMGRFVKRGAKVVLKPNVLTGRPPEYAVTTNPLVMAALTRLCLEAGAASVTVLDNPTSSARPAFEESGIARAVQAAGGTVKYLSDRNFEKIEIPQGRVLHSWPLVTDIFEADCFINVPIGKTHGLAGLTLSMKNLMGIMGGSRGIVHVDFSQKIVDLSTLVRPHLVVLDATRILTANGPTGGNLADVKQLDTIVAGVSPVSVDAYGATLFDRRPTDLAYLVKAQEQGLGETDLGRLTIVRKQA